MQNTSMFDTLLELPMFRGVSREKIAEVVGRSKFHFLKFGADSEVVRFGEKCTHLKFILRGRIRLTTAAPDNNYSISQTLEGPDVVLPDFLFGRVTSYPSTGKSLTEVSMLQIEKSDYLKILAEDNVFLLNYLNYLSMDAQKNMGVLALSGLDIEKRIAFRIIALTQASGKEIELECSQGEWWRVFGVEKTLLVGALERMRTQGLIDFRCPPPENNSQMSVICVKNRRGLVDLLTDGGSF